MNLRYWNTEERINMQRQFVSKQDLVELGFREHQAKNIIQQTKIVMVNDGYPLYNNRRIGIVPLKQVEKVLGTRLGDDMGG